MRKATQLWVLTAMCLAAVARAASAQAPAPKTDVYDDVFREYLEAARAQARAVSNGRSINWMASLAGDPRASQPNDLVTVQVVEVISASGSAESALTKGSSAAAGVPHLLGVQNKLPSWLNPASLLSASSKSEFEGRGATARSGVFTAMVTARVVEVLPNGDLLLEGIREVEINTDRQVIVLSGVVRPVDIGPNNVVPSTAIGQLRIRYFGQGLMKD
ncbi:MAG TPA: flagellar basal body L-ring protein FlgH, partial [Vicinamibacterales bacterium]|nr:flagellar basal body L-ring protein FlgH [Vicinamibacterales bacterium]